jgi:hypothetical protein
MSRINHEFDEPTSIMFNTGKSLNEFMGTITPMIQTMADNNPMTRFFPSRRDWIRHVQR